MLLFNMFTLLQLKLTYIVELFICNFAVSAKLPSRIIKSIRTPEESQANHLKARENIGCLKIGFPL